MIKKNSPRFTRDALMHCGFVLLILHAAIVIAFWVWLFSVPHMFDIIEVHVLNIVYWWRLGLNLPYPSMDRLPAIWNCYGLVYEGICAWLPSVIHPYFVGRFLSFLAMLGVLTVMAVWVRRQTGSWKWSALGALLLLTAKPIFAFGVLHRVDSLAVFLSFSGFVLTLLFNRPVVVALGTILMAMGFHTKLTIIAAPLACLLALWRIDKPKAIWVGVSWLAFSIGGLIGLQIITHGRYLMHAVLGNEPSMWTKPLDMLTRPITSSPFWVALALWLWRKANCNVREKGKPILFYLGLSLAIAGITSTNPGSSWNYLLDTYVALAALTGILLALTSNWGQSMTRKIWALLLAHAIFSLVHTSYFCLKDVKAKYQYRQTFLSCQERLTAIMQHAEKIAILGSGAGMDALLSLGRPNPISLPKKMSEHSKRLAAKALAEGQLDLVLIGDDLKPLQK